METLVQIQQGTPTLERVKMLTLKERAEMFSWNTPIVDLTNRLQLERAVLKMLEDAIKQDRAFVIKALEKMVQE